jgi:hypothetical protein
MFPTYAIDFKEKIPLGWELIPGLLKRFTNSGSVIPYLLGCEESLFGPPFKRLIFAGCIHQSPDLQMFKEPRNRFQGLDSDRLGTVSWVP